MGDSRIEYGAAADVVDEGPTVGRTLWVYQVSHLNQLLPQSLSCAGAIGTIENESANRFDTRRRLIGTTVTNRDTSPSGRVLGITDVSYLTWDAQGRPTSATAASNGESLPAAVIAYDDVARTKTTTSPGFSIVITYDADGNVVRGSSIDYSSNGSVIDAVTTITATQRVCK